MAGGRDKSLTPEHTPQAHLPVLFMPVMNALRVLGDGKYLDGTLGRGGHAMGVLERLGPKGRLLLMDKDPEAIARSEEHTSELQSLMRISYAVFCLKKKKTNNQARLSPYTTHNPLTTCNTPLNTH